MSFLLGNRGRRSWRSRVLGLPPTPISGSLCENVLRENHPSGRHKHMLVRELYSRYLQRLMPAGFVLVKSHGDQVEPNEKLLKYYERKRFGRLDFVMDSLKCTSL